MSLPVAFCGSECYGGGGLSVGVDCGACYPCAFYTVVYEAVLEWCPCTSRQYEVGGDAVFGYFAQECQVGGVSGLRRHAVMPNMSAGPSVIFRTTVHMSR